jgi:hypothetical protein
MNTNTPQMRKHSVSIYASFKDVRDLLTKVNNTAIGYSRQPVSKFDHQWKSAEGYDWYLAVFDNDFEIMIRNSYRKDQQDQATKLLTINND